MKQKPDTPVVCNLDALSTEEQQQRAELAARIRSSVIEMSETKLGYRLTLKPDDDLYRDTLELILLERKCCPFLILGLEFDVVEGPVYFDISGAANVKAFLRSNGVLGCGSTDSLEISAHRRKK